MNVRRRGLTFTVEEKKFARYCCDGSHTSAAVSRVRYPDNKRSVKLVPAGFVISLEFLGSSIAFVYAELTPHHRIVLLAMSIHCNLLCIDTIPPSHVDAKAQRMDWIAIICVGLSAALRHAFC